MRSSRRALLLALIALGAALTGCAPEGNRERGGGPGADIGNWGQPVRMHGDEDPVRRIYHQTPSAGKGIERSR